MCFPRPCRFVARRFILPRQFAVCEPLPGDLAHAEHESLAAVQVFAVVGPESLLIEATVEMKRFDTHVGSVGESRALP